jgi:hypothetical protein
MNKNESKREILTEWEKWAEDPNSDNYEQMDRFYRWLSKERPELFTWETPSADNPIQESDFRWQDVRGWLNVRTGFGQDK